MCVTCIGTGEKSQVKNIALNQDLILRFLRSVSPFLSTGPSRNPLKKTAHNTSSNKGKGRGGRKGKGAINGEEDDGDDDDELEGVSDLDEDEVMAAEAGASGSSEVKNQKGTVLITLRDAVPYTLWFVSLTQVVLSLSPRTRR
jgi:25S rRNA (uracil2634-N3)-methyltransferase